MYEMKPGNKPGQSQLPTQNPTPRRTAVDRIRQLMDISRMQGQLEPGG